MTFQKPIGFIAAATLMLVLIPAAGAQALTKTPTPTATSALTATPAGTAAAQLDQSNFTCTLAAKDCALLSAAEANAGTESSFQQAITFRMNLNQGSSNPIYVNVQANGTGAVSIAPIADMTDTAAVYKAIQAQLNLTGSAAQSSGKIDMVLKDGIFYVETPNSLTWTGIDLIKLIALSKEAQTSGTQAATNQALQQALTDAAQDSDFQAAAAAIPNLPGWIVQQRISDTFLEGQRMAQIQYTYNPQVLFTSPQFATILQKLLPAVINNLPATTQGLNQLQPLTKLNALQLQGVMTILSGVLGKTNIKYIRWIGVTDQKIHALSVTINLNIVPAALNTGSTSKTVPPPPLNGTITFSVQATKIGKPVTVTAPEGVTMVTESQLRRALGLPGNSLTPVAPAVTPVGSNASVFAAPASAQNQ